jgi:hypothetical protein
MFHYVPVSVNSPSLPLSLRYTAQAKHRSVGLTPALLCLSRLLGRTAGTPASLLAAFAIADFPPPEYTFSQTGRSFSVTINSPVYTYSADFLLDTPAPPDHVFSAVYPACLYDYVEYLVTRVLY